MTTMTIELKDEKKKSFIRDLLKKYDFIEILEENHYSKFFELSKEIDIDEEAISQLRNNSKI